MNTVDYIFNEASTLSEDQKLTLVHRLLVSTEPHPSEEIERAWNLEIQKRIEQYDRGLTTLRDASKVFADLEQRLGS